MAVADPVLIGTPLFTSLNQASYTYVPGVTLTAGRLYVLIVWNMDNNTAGDNIVPAVTGQSQTWVPDGNIPTGNTVGMISFHRCIATGATAGNLTIDLGAAAQTGCGAILLEIPSGFEPGDNGANALGTAVASAVNANQPQTATVAAFADAAESLLLAAALHNVASSGAFADMAELFDEVIATPNRTFVAAWRRGGSTTASYSQADPGGAQKRVLAIEVIPATAEPEVELLAATRVLDDFDRPDSSSLGTTQRVGASAPPAWTNVVSSGTVELGVEDGRAAYLSSSGTNLSTYAWVPGYADQIVTVDVTLSDDGRANAGLMLRGVDDGTYLFVKLERGTSNWPTGAVLLNAYGGDDGAGSHARVNEEMALTAEQTYRLTVWAADDLVRIYVDGALVLEHTLSPTDAGDFTGTRTGIRWRVDANPDNGEDGGSRFDDFEVLELGVDDGLRVGVARSAVSTALGAREGSGSRDALSWAGAMFASASRAGVATRRVIAWAEGSESSASRTGSGHRNVRSWSGAAHAAASRTGIGTRVASSFALIAWVSATAIKRGLRVATAWARGAVAIAARTGQGARRATSWSASALSLGSRSGVAGRAGLAFARQVATAASRTGGGLRTAIAWASRSHAFIDRHGSGSRTSAAFAVRADAASERVGEASRFGRAWARIARVVTSVVGSKRIDIEAVVGRPRTRWGAELQPRWATGPIAERWDTEGIA